MGLATPEEMHHHSCQERDDEHDPESIMAGAPQQGEPGQKDRSLGHAKPDRLGLLRQGDAQFAPDCLGHLHTFFRLVRALGNWFAMITAIAPGSTLCFSIA